MSKTRLLSALVFTGTLAGAVAMPQTAEAYSVRVHIHLANEIRDALIKNWDAVDCTEGEDPWCGKPAIKLLGPGDEPQWVLLDKDNAEAIRDNPEFWRGGAIGPDNTVFPGLTDPSHAWHFFPFSQCQAMLDNAETPPERAYALGCFLHGTTDNNVHHVVNYFSGETFTLYPKDAAQDGELRFHLLNVVRHITVEGKIEKALTAARPEAFTAEKMKHAIAKDLYRRVYLDPNDEGRGLWHWFAGDLVQRKNDALRAAQLDGFDPNDELETSIEELREQGVTIDLDGRVMDAYIDFLKAGGSVEVLSPGSLAPYEYVLLLPEIIEDVKRLLDITEARGVQRMGELVAEWEAEGECGLSCPILVSKKKLWQHIFQGTANTRSLYGQAVDLKKEQLNEVIEGYLGSVERLSNLLVEKGPAGLALADITFATQPLVDAIDRVTDFPYEVLFPAWAVDIIDSIAPLRSFLEGSIRLVTEEFKKQIVERMNEYTRQLREQLLALSPQVIQDINAKVNELKEIAIAQIDAAKLEALGIDLSDGDAAFKSFDTSVLYMNSYNSIAGVLANQELVFSQAATSFSGGGPVSFDASWQVGYTQMSVCEDLAAAFYPCGTSAIEVLQPDFRECETIEMISPEMQPNIECHDGSAVEFDSDPNPATCVKRDLETIIGPEEGHLGSYSLAYPADLADRGPECVGLSVPGSLGVSGDRPEDNAGGSSSDDDAGSDGCACSSDPTRRETPWWLALAVVGLVTRRRRL
ncbi:MAG: MYXO-CTERM sorting domain-containing protein [Nannocystaceae bacterium]|nr:MYXO-CTERM sorting domain-containing protein [Nannocystaceae bacterium]